MKIYLIDWDETEKETVTERILRLTDSQIEELFDKTGISWLVAMDEVIEEVRQNKKESTSLETLLTEADSKENLLRVVSNFEQN